MTSKDSIEREITIQASLARVWDLVNEPGWWVGESDRTQQTRRREGDVQVIVDAKYGTFPVRLVASEPQRYVSYRWASGFPGEDPGKTNSTLVEFWLSEQAGGTLLRVVESGFGALDVTEETRTKSIEGNTEGWAFELDLLKSWAEQVTA